MPTVSVVDSTRPIADAVAVVGAYTGPTGPRLAPGADQVDGTVGEHLAAAYRDAGGKGALDDVVLIPTLGLARYPLIAVAGLGSPDAAAESATVSTGAITADERVRRAVGAAARALTAHPKLRICLSDPALDPAALVEAAAFGAAVGGYRYDRYHAAAATKSESAKPRRGRANTIAVSVEESGPATTRALRRALALADAVNLARDLVNAPPNDMYPETFAREVSQLAAKAGVAAEVLAEKELARQGYAGTLAVGGGSAHGPRLLRLMYRPPRPRTSIALVGEGTTFNSGGLSLKTAQMAWSKADMAGAAAVAAAVFAIARLKLPITVTATIPLAENLPSATSFRPSDIVAVRGGRTVEVTDTEAGGRVMLAEAIGRAAADQPDYLLEASSLTSAQRVALGPGLIAVMGSTEWRDQVTASGRARGEGSWAMPMPTELRAGLKSAAADLVTTAGDRWGAMLSGAAFLADFVPADLPWAHLDITGPAWNTGGARGYTPKGATGAGVVTLVAALESLLPAA